MAAVITFGISLAGIIGLLAWKRWELNRRPSWYARVRVALDRRALILFRILRRVPQILGEQLLIVGHAIVCRASELSLTAVRFLERKLYRFVNMVKGRGDINREKGAVSLFLKNVVEYRDQVRKENGYH